MTIGAKEIAARFDDPKLMEMIIEGICAIEKCDAYDLFTPGQFFQARRAIAWLFVTRLGWTRGQAVAMLKLDYKDTYADILAPVKEGTRNWEYRAVCANALDIARRDFDVRGQA